MSTKKFSVWFVMLLIVSILVNIPNPASAMMQEQNPQAPEIPFFPGLTWENQGEVRENIIINTGGDALSLNGASYEAKESFDGAFPKEIYNYYSNSELAVAGWSSHNAYQDEAGTHQIFYHEAGFYLMVEFLQCEFDDFSTCIRVWLSDPEATAVFVAGNIEKQDQTTINSSSFSKLTPASGAASVNPSSIVLSWEAYSPTPEKYSYCIKADSPCSEDDPEWTGTFLDRSVTLTNLQPNKTYHWQVKAITCLSCSPKTFVYANSGTWWTFNTAAVVVNISGNAGVAGATLTYTDGGVKNVTADGSGNYTLPVSYNWSGTVTPTKMGYSFSPLNKSYSEVKTNQTGQNYTASLSFRSISGNTGAANTSLVYFDGTTKIATTDVTGFYSFLVPNGWSGSVTPLKTGYTFTPSSRSYSNISADQTAQDYMVQATTYKISGNAGGAGVTLSYTDGVAKTVTSQANGDYELFVSAFWNGTVTPSKTGYTFSPPTRTYTNVNLNIPLQNYAANPITFTISGNAGAAGVALNYTDGTAKQVLSNSSGDYSLPVSYNWSGDVTPTKTAFAFTPVKRTYSNVLANFAGQNYTAQDLSWVGSATITSSQSLVVVARPEIGSQYMTYNGFSQGSTSVFVPMLFKNAFVGGSYKSALYIQNFHAVNSSDITIEFYDANGISTCTINDTIAAQASKGYWLPSLGCLGTSWVGGAVITSVGGEPLAAIGRPQIGSEIMTYRGFSAGSLHAYVPMLFKDAFGGAYDAALYVQNVDSAGTANITMRYYDTSGALTCTQTDTLAPLASKGYWLPSIACLGQSWSGAVEVTANRNIVAVARPHIGTQITTYNGFSQGSNASYLPAMAKNIAQDNNTLNSAFYIQNIDAANATVTMKFFASDGTETCSQTDTIAPLSSKGYWLPSITCLGASWEGSVEITSTENIVAVGRPHIGSEITTFNAGSNGFTTLYLPMLFKWAFGGTYNSSVYLTNATALDAAVTLDFYDQNGNLTCTKSESVPGSGMLRLQLANSACP